jgi:UDP-3-O-[3-hydroxymyristoyl] glucosamine N-acyltransferase
MARVVTRWFAQRPMPSGISPLASIAKSAKLGANVAVGPFVTIADRVVVGDNVKIFQAVSIEAESMIGEDTIIYPLVSIYYRSTIGKRCIIHSGAVIGADGYGFATEGGRHHKIPQIGVVRIEDDVEIGAGTTIDRAALGETLIGEGTKIDNLVQIGHNVKVGKHCLLVSQAGIAGSTELGDYVVMAGQAGASGHLKIGAEAQIAAKSAVFEDVPEKTKVRGIPAIAWRDYSRREVWLNRISELARRIDELEKKLGES